CPAGRRGAPHGDRADRRTPAAGKAARARRLRSRPSTARLRPQPRGRRRRRPRGARRGRTLVRDRRRDRAGAHSRLARLLRPDTGGTGARGGRTVARLVGRVARSGVREAECGTCAPLPRARRVALERGYDMKGFLALEDGTVFRGESVGADGFAFGEAVFTTAMTGYQEIVTDPSFAEQIVAFTAPM